MTSELISLVAGWVAAHDVTTAYATSVEGREALARAGVHADAPGPGPGEAEKRDLVLTELGASSDAEVTRVAALASKVVVVLADNARRPFHSDRIMEVGPLVWSIGRVRERIPFDLPASMDGVKSLVPARFLRRLTRREAWVIDVTPRTPQARRKLLRTVP
jgi:hypothetical protein